LEYFAWFADILRRVENDNGLAEEFVREALWAPQARSVRDRVTVWAKRMTEWAPGGYDRGGELAWEQLSEDLIAIEGKVEKLRLGSVTKTTVGEEVTIQSLIDEGRLGGALRLAREEAVQRGESFKVTRDRSNAVHLVEACQQLAELGDALNAAAIVAPHVNCIHDIDKWWANEAIKILARARTEKAAGETLVEEASIGSIASTTIGTMGDQAKPKYRSAGSSE
jgi:hypothetical protein